MARALTFHPSFQEAFKAMQPIHKLLIANRGEIAVRIAHTCRSMGIATVAVYSDADADALHVREADEAIRIGPAASRESYLRMDRIIEAATAVGADAIHPGFGFLAENAAFAEAVADAGLRFVGPSPNSIRAMGSKKEARERMQKAGVPTVPGYNGEDQNTDNLIEQAEKIGLPVMVKASSGGGGKGMRIVRESSALRDAIEGARREAASSFGDDTLLIEKYVEKPRHVEVQIIGDQHGNLVHLFERECSIQRRHQKIIEESPSPALDEALRKEMGDAAIAAGASIDYYNAGTVEFILDASGAFYFLEVNTRLQVEHPVTELVTGIDLVREQIRVAEGLPLSFSQQELSQRGSAIECRIYAEDPGAGFLPSTGVVSDWHFPAQDGLRIDTGVERGDVVAIHYDPMLAKVITWGSDRYEATRRMVAALQGASIAGVTTNRDLLVRILQHRAWTDGELDTHFLDSHFSDALATPQHKPSERLALTFATLRRIESLAHRVTAGHYPDIRPGFRTNRFRDAQTTWRIGDDEHTVHWRVKRDESVDMRHDDDATSTALRLVRIVEDEWTVEFDAERRLRARIVDGAGCVHVQLNGRSLTLREVPLFPDGEDEIEPGSCLAPMPGKIVDIAVAEGDAVKAGQVLVVMEAMKMEHTVTAPEDGTVGNIFVKLDQQVEADEVLARVDPD